MPSKAKAFRGSPRRRTTCCTSKILLIIRPLPTCASCMINDDRGTASKKYAEIINSSKRRMRRGEKGYTIRERQAPGREDEKRKRAKEKELYRDTSYLELNLFQTEHQSLPSSFYNILASAIETSPADNRLRHQRNLSREKQHLIPFCTRRYCANMLSGLHHKTERTNYELRHRWWSPTLMCLRMRRESNILCVYTRARQEARKRTERELRLLPVCMVSFFEEARLVDPRRNGNRRFDHKQNRRLIIWVTGPR